MQKITINEELRTLLPPLSHEEYAGLEASLLRDGCLTPLIVWNGILIDGLQRYEICRKHKIPFTVRKLDFSSFDEALRWRWEHQIHRRNLTPFQRAELALKLKDAIAAKAKERQRQAQSTGKPIGGRPIETSTELAGIADVSHGTMRKAEYLAKHADPVTKDRLRQGEKGISISSEYQRLRNLETSRASSFGEDRLTRPVAPRNIETFGFNGADSKSLANWLFQHRTLDFVRGLVRNMINDSRIRRPGETKQEHLRSLNGKPLE